MPAVAPTPSDDGRAVWKADLMANANRHGVSGAAAAWLTSPGFVVVTLYRLSHWANRRGGAFRLLSILAWRAIAKGYGCYIDPSAVIGPGLRLPHPVGVVVANGAVVGAGVTLYHGVTLGRGSADIDGAPTLGDGVCIYANASVLGPIRVGNHAVVAAHALVRRDVPAGDTAVGVPAVIKPAAAAKPQQRLP